VVAAASKREERRSTGFTWEALSQEVEVSSRAG